MACFFIILLVVSFMIMSLSCFIIYIPDFAFELIFETLVIISIYLQQPKCCYKVKGIGLLDVVHAHAKLLLNMMATLANCLSENLNRILDRHIGFD